MIDWRNIHKEPLFYYIAVPVVIAIWPLWLLAFGLPKAEENLEKDRQRYQEAQGYIETILGELDPERLDYARAKKTDEQFDYTAAVDQVTRFCGISPSNYRLSASGVRKMRGGQQSRDANITIEKIDLERFAKFMSIMHMRWANLQCTSASLTKIRDEKNLWKADLRFIHYQ